MHTIHLEAKLPEKNLFRFFKIMVGQNLFGEREILVNNGRIGTKGRVRFLKFEDELTQFKKLRQMVLKRINAHKRLGCAYHITETTFDSQTLLELTHAKKRTSKKLS